MVAESGAARHKLFKIRFVGGKTLELCLNGCKPVRASLADGKLELAVALAAELFFDLFKGLAGEGAQVLNKLVYLGADVAYPTLGHMVPGVVTCIDEKYGDI